MRQKATHDFSLFPLKDLGCKPTFFNVSLSKSGIVKKKKNQYNSIIFVLSGNVTFWDKKVCLLLTIKTVDSPGSVRLSCNVIYCVCRNPFGPSPSLLRDLGFRGTNASLIIIHSTAIIKTKSTVSKPGVSCLCQHP